MILSDVLLVFLGVRTRYRTIVRTIDGGRVLPREQVSFRKTHLEMLFPRSLLRLTRPTSQLNRFVFDIKS